MTRTTFTSAVLLLLAGGCGDDADRDRPSVSERDASAVDGLPARDSGAPGPSVGARPADSGAAGSPARDGGPSSTSTLDGGIAQGMARDDAGRPDTATHSGEGGLAEAGAEGASVRATHGWNELTGAPIGEGSLTTAMLRKELQVKPSGESSFTVGRGFAIRTSAQNLTTDVVVSVTNVSSAARCFVEGSPLTWKTDAGEIITGGNSFLSGSSLTNAAGDITTSTCLAAGEQGWLIDSEFNTEAAAMYERVAAVELNLRSSGANGYAPPLHRVVPVSYQVTGEELTVSFVNQGTAVAPLSSETSLRYLLIDAERLPLAYGYLDLVEPRDILPGGSASAADTIFYDGRASSVLLLLSY